MPVKLRLRRQGRSKAPHYSIVAADSRSPRDGRYIEKIGFYNPLTEPAQVFVDHNAAIKWLGTGAQPTNTVRSLLRHTGVTVKFALIKQGKTEEEIERIYGRWRAEKDGKQKKKVVSVDVHGNLLEPVPDQPEKKVTKPAPAPAPEAKEEAAPAPEAKEEAPSVVETVTEKAEEVAEAITEVAEAVEEKVEEVAEAVEEIVEEVTSEDKKSE